MGWFFKKKKVTVPLPEHSDDLLKFPESTSKIPAPEDIKKSVGLEEPPQMPDMEPLPTEISEEKSFPKPTTMSTPALNYPFFLFFL